MFAMMEYAFIESLEITALVFVALVAMDLVYVYTRGKLSAYLQNRPQTQYLTGALLGAIPGCEGAFFAISLHTHGLISFGALLAAFIATTGDEALVMLSLFPLKTLGLTALLAVIGYFIGRVVDIFQKRVAPQHLAHCDTILFHPSSRFSWKHYWQEHLWSHLIRKHLLRIFLWTFLAIFLIKWGTSIYPLKDFLGSNPYLVLLTAAVIGLIPQSGPHLLFVTMFAENTIPFSIFFTNMFVQNGHALLPLLSISVRESVLIKVIGLVLGVGLGSLLFFLDL